MKLYTEVFILLLAMILVADYFLYKQFNNGNPVIKILNISSGILFIVFFTWVKLFSMQINNYHLPIIIMWINLFFLCIYVPKIIVIFFTFLKNNYEKHRVALNSVQYMILFAFVFVFVYSSTITPFQFSIKKTEISLPDLPSAFNDFVIVQLSDIHLGSKNVDIVRFKHLVQLVNSQQPDLIVFTGDMVNNFADEMNGYQVFFSKMKAKVGKFAVLGNHDYGDYTEWDSKELKSRNFERINAGLRSFGFTLLLNEHVFLHTGKDSLALIGVENYYKNPKKNYAKLDKAIARLNDATFQILMSHNPTHWEHEVLKHKSIKLTLSGHTHAAQMGTEIFGKVVSPAVLLYPQYNGLYGSGSQQIYVSRGLGYIGLPINIGLQPEITVLKLKVKK